MGGSASGTPESAVSASGYTSVHYRGAGAVPKQLECRVVVLYLPDRRVELGMYDPVGGRFEPLGTHGPDSRAVDVAVRGLVQRIEREGHRVSFCERRK